MALASKWIQTQLLLTILGTQGAQYCKLESVACVLCRLVSTNKDVGSICINIKNHDGLRTQPRCQTALADGGRLSRKSIFCV